MDQAAALPFRILPGVANIAGEAIDILLVTSRDTGRWVLPKGHVEAGEAGHEAALREAVEEAGASGSIDHRAVGIFRYTKRAADGSENELTVEVYPLRVRELANDWAERKVRDRQWFSRAEAAAVVDEAELRALIAGFYG